MILFCLQSVQDTSFFIILTDACKQTDSFIYTLNLETSYGKPVQKTGNVTVIR
ncbi:MAG: hypothetical protein Q8R57_09335 [Bacteroidota bacterium]|nr:hypothetical protein [Bacteroidota bacterium]